MRVKLERRRRTKKTTLQLRNAQITYFTADTATKLSAGTQPKVKRKTYPNLHVLSPKHAHAPLFPDPDRGDERKSLEEVVASALRTRNDRGGREGSASLMLMGRVWRRRRGNWGENTPFYVRLGKKNGCHAWPVPSVSTPTPFFWDY